MIKSKHNDMKQLQNNFTTLEQSKRLLELGVPADSADMFYDMSYRPIINIIPDGIKFSELDTYFDSEICEDNDYLPCWSVGRLIEIYNLCAHGFYTLTKVPKDLIEHILSRYDWEIRHVGMDFSKLDNDIKTK